jgi:hypothetical protein
MTQSRKLSILVRDRKSLQEKVGELTIASTPIILITTTVWKTHYAALGQLGYRVANNTAIPHPAFGNSRKFRDSLAAILKSLGLL